jgi:hypothetical protein
VVQSNLGNTDDAQTIAEACKKIGVGCDLVHRVPFSKELPDVPTDVPTIFYGSTRFVNLVWLAKKWIPCAFFDAEKFVRPDRDLKEFQGGVWSFADLQRWKTGLLKTDLGEEQLAHIPILVGEPWGITTEWRLFMVNGIACTASQYRKGRHLNVSSEVPDEVLFYGHAMARKFSPHDIFVLDICESAGNLYVLEVGCVNSAGFYACDIFEIVRAVSERARANNGE